MAKKAVRLTAEEVAALAGQGDPAPDPGGVEIRPVSFAELEEGPPRREEEAGPVAFLWDVPMTVEVELGAADLAVRDVLALGPGSVVELDRSYGEPLDIRINGRLVARGEVVIAGENFGVRITEILVSPAELAGTSSDGEPSAPGGETPPAANPAPEAG
ncbi:MAG: flagellar motor switch protein FliN [Firmicutes bacterium]|nr:flagellar motor switch protein FliN [Bacillota bacterium]